MVDSKRLLSLHRELNSSRYKWSSERTRPSYFIRVIQRMNRYYFVASNDKQCPLLVRISQFYKMGQAFQFLCGNYNDINFVFATKFDDHAWHYFEEQHSICLEHDMLPPNLDSVIKNFKKARTIEIFLSEEQAKNYYDNGKFIFKNTELQTYLTLDNVSTEKKPIKQNGPKTKKLIFDSGVTNPILFLADFEKCEDVKTNDEKLEKIRHFVDDEHKAVFSHLRFTSDWNTAKTKFLTTYALPFIENRKNDLNFDFFDQLSLRSFVGRKIEMLTKYTTLSPMSQMDIILNELLTDIAHLFIVNGKFDCPIDNILDFCDSVDEICERHKPVQDHSNVDVEEPLNNMVLFRYDPNVEPTPSTSRDIRGKAKSMNSIGRVSKSGRPKKMKLITEDSENEDDMDVEVIDDNSDRMSSVSDSTVTSRHSISSSFSRSSAQSRYSLRSLKPNSKLD